MTRTRMLGRTMVDTCSILRPTAQSTDGYGLPQPSSWGVVAEDLPCRLIRSRRWLYHPETGQGALIDECRLFLAAGTEVRLGDRIEIDDKQYQIEAIVPRRDSHLRLDLKVSEWEATS